MSPNLEIRARELIVFALGFPGHLEGKHLQEGRRRWLGTLDPAVFRTQMWQHRLQQVPATRKAVRDILTGLCLGAAFSSVLHR